MADTFHIEVHWGNRQETARECAGRLTRMLHGLARTNVTFARWNKQAMTRAKADVPFCVMPPRIDEIERPGAFRYFAYLYAFSLTKPESCGRVLTS